MQGMSTKEGSTRGCHTEVPSGKVMHQSNALCGELSDKAAGVFHEQRPAIKMYGLWQ